MCLICSAAPVMKGFTLSGLCSSSLALILEGVRKSALKTCSSLITSLSGRKSSYLSNSDFVAFPPHSLSKPPNFNLTLQVKSQNSTCHSYQGHFMTRLMIGKKNQQALSTVPRASPSMTQSFFTFSINPTEDQPIEITLWG